MCYVWVVSVLPQLTGLHNGGPLPLPPVPPLCPAQRPSPPPPPPPQAEGIGEDGGPDGLFSLAKLKGKAGASLAADEDAAAPDFDDPADLATSSSGEEAGGSGEEDEADSEDEQRRWGGAGAGVCGREGGDASVGMGAAH